VPDVLYICIFCVNVGQNGTSGARSTRCGTPTSMGTHAYEICIKIVSFSSRNERETGDLQYLRVAVFTLALQDFLVLA
jgi:hypothetical protein